MAEGSGPGDRLRLFLAVEMPSAVREALGGWQLDSSAGLSELRQVRSTGLHITLCFLGWQPSGAQDPIVGACRAVPAHPRPKLTLGEAIWLPPRRPRVLAVRLRDQAGRLAAIQSELSGRLQAGGWYVPENRPYLPHVTVARVRKGARVSPQPLPSPPEQSFTASELTLFRSRLGPGGAQYEALARVALGPE